MLPRLINLYAPAMLLAHIVSASAEAASSGQPADDRSPDRARMVQQIATMAAQTAADTGRAVFSPRVMAALGRVQRHRFVPAAIADTDAPYENRPLAIGEGQTISQPYIVALMTELLDVKPGDSVLEIGTGSGYQAAVLAELAARVYTIELLAPLAQRAAVVLGSLGYRNISTRTGDGYAGWREYAPFDAIMVTAAPPEVPQALIDQLKPGGRMVVPVGARGGVQQLLVIDKQADGRTLRRDVLGVQFVPMVPAVPSVRSAPPK